MPKKQAGAELKKKGIFWPKIDQLKKKRNWGGKKQAEAERKKKKKFGGKKLGKNLIIRSRNCPILKQNRTFQDKKKQAGAELRNKKRILWVKNLEKL